MPRYRKRAHSKRRSYRKGMKSKRFGKIRHGKRAYVKPVKRYSFRGIRTKVSKKTERKFVDLLLPNAVLVPSMGAASHKWVTIWQLNGNDNYVPTNFFPVIPQGITRSSRIGNEIITLWADIRFYLEFVPALDIGGNLQLPYVDYVRLIAVKQRSRDMDFLSDGQRNSIFPQSMNEPINPQNVKVIFDRTYPIHTGVNDPTLGAPNNLLTHSKAFNIKVPLKKLLKYAADGTSAFTWFPNVGIFATCYNGGNPAGFDTQFRQLYVRYWYMDP